MIASGFPDREPNSKYYRSLQRRHAPRKFLAQQAEWWQNSTGRRITSGYIHGTVLPFPPVRLVDLGTVALKYSG